MLDSSGLRIDRNTYYNLVRGKPLDESSNSFKGLVLALEEMGFRFTCRIDKELANDNLVQGRVLQQIFFTIDTQLA